MQRQTSTIRCFVILCFSAAIALAAFEWRSPIPRRVITPDDLSGIGSGIDMGGQTAFAQVPSDPETGIWAWLNLRSQPKPSDPVAVADPLTQVVLSLDTRQLEVHVPGKPTIRYEVAVGQADWQTPTGEFAIMNKLENPTWQHPITKDEIPPGPENPLGSHWIGFWSDGQAQIGFHGTNQEELIGEAVSHGCVRMRNRDIRDLYQRVGLGTLVTVKS